MKVRKKPWFSCQSFPPYKKYTYTTCARPYPFVTRIWIVNYPRSTHEEPNMVMIMIMPYGYMLFDLGNAVRI